MLQTFWTEPGTAPTEAGHLLSIPDGEPITVPSKRRVAPETPGQAGGRTQNHSADGWEPMSDRRHELIVRELSHRMKNMTSVLAAILRMTAEEHDDVETYRRAVLDRLQAFSRAEILIADRTDKVVQLEDLLRLELAPFDQHGRIQLDGPCLRLSHAAAQSLALVMHELATNAAKYGSLSVPHGTLTVAWSLRDEDGCEMLSLRWAEADGPPVVRSHGEGFGSTLLRKVTHVLGGEGLSEFTREGLRFSLRLPAAGLRPQAAAGV